MNDFEWASSQDNKLAEKYTHVQALMHLHSIADKKGLIQSTLGSLATEWNWHKQQVSRFIDKLRELEYCDGNVTDGLRLTYLFSVRKRPRRDGPVTDKRKQPDLSKYTEEELLKWQQAKQWFEKFCPRVQKLPEPINIDEYFKLTKDFNRLELTTALKNMQNHKPLLTKYVSAYRTVRNWAKNEQKR